MAATGDLHGAGRARAGELPGVDEATVVDGAVHLLAAEAAAGCSTGVIDAADEAGAEVASVELVEPDLEAVFLHLTGKALRD